MKTYYRDSYGCTASIEVRRDGTAKLTVCLANGSVYIRRPYGSERGAKIALGKCSDSWVKK